jgi:glycosyltransferase involved in cell wall biosynthesis
MTKVRATAARKLETLSIIATGYNEAALLKDFVKEVRQVIEILENKYGIKALFIFVDDASTDKSVQELWNACDRHIDAKILTTTRRCGLDESFLLGISQARTDAVVLIQSDLQDTPSLITLMVDEFLRYADSSQEIDVVLMQRSKRHGESGFKLFLTRLGYSILGGLYDFAAPNDIGDFYLLSKRAYSYLLALSDPKPFLRAMIWAANFPSAVLQYERLGRPAQTVSKFPMWNFAVYENFISRALVGGTTKPLRGMIFVSCLIALASLTFIGIVLVQKNLGLHQPGWPSLMTAILLLGGLQLLASSAIAIYVYQIFLSVKKLHQPVVSHILETSRQ